MLKNASLACALAAAALVPLYGCDDDEQAPPGAGGSAGASSATGGASDAGAPELGTVGGERASTLPTVQGGPALGKQDRELKPLATFPGPAQPVGIAVSRAGRRFVSFPRWEDPVRATVVELRDGKLEAFPDEQTNAFDASAAYDFDPTEHFISAQSIVFDESDRLWVLDTGSINFSAVINGGPKLWAYDIDTRERLQAISFPNDVAMKRSALNDVRFDLNRGPQGTAYITDSGAGGIVVVDLASGRSWRHLDEDPSVLPTPGLQTETEGRPFLQHKRNGEIDEPDFRSDGIALSPDGQTLYYTVVISHDIYSVPTELLADPDTDEETLSTAVKLVATKPSGNDGIACDAQSRIYTTDFEDNSLRRIDPETGDVTVITQDERLIWPDTLAFSGNDLYVTVNQLPRQPNYRGGDDTREPPYVLFRLRNATER